jgi:hypothetical protein
MEGWRAMEKKKREVDVEKFRDQKRFPNLFIDPEDLFKPLLKIYYTQGVQGLSEFFPNWESPGNIICSGGLQVKPEHVRHGHVSINYNSINDSFFVGDTQTEYLTFRSQALYQENAVRIYEHDWQTAYVARETGSPASFILGIDVSKVRLSSSRKKKNREAEEGNLTCIGRAHQFSDIQA